MKKSKMSGIQKKYLKYMCTLLILALVLSSICVWTYVRRNMTDVIVDKYVMSLITATLIIKEMFTKNPIPRLVIRIFKAAVCVRKWGMSMRRRSGSGPGITCLVRGMKHCLSEDM